MLDAYLWDSALVVYTVAYQWCENLRSISQLNVHESRITLCLHTVQTIVRDGVVGRVGCCVSVAFNFEGTIVCMIVLISHFLELPSVYFETFGVLEKWHKK